MSSSPTLTQFPEGSLRELWKISFPLMISAFASLCMLFTDRIFLARYSIDALNAVVNAGTLAWAAIGGMGMMTAMSEVFVAQYNGAKLYEKIGTPVWQMIYLSFFSYVLFLPLAIFAPQIFSFTASGSLEVVFFRWLMIFGPCYALMTALAGFFVGRGKTTVLIVVAIIANIVNIFLDWMLIFGLPPYIPELGVRGAAIATSCGYALQALLLAVLFFKKKYRAMYGTNQWKFDPELFQKCFRIGFPQGVFVSLEIFGWAVFFWLMTSMSQTHITVSSICQSLLILFSFFGDGLSRGIAAAAGNLIGAKKINAIYRVTRSALILQTLFSLFVAAIFLVDFEGLIRVLFIEHIDLVSSSNMPWTTSLHFCLILTFCYMFFEGIRWIFAGLLIAAGDTFFLLVAGSLSVWVGLLIPIYWIVVRHQLPVEYAWVLACLYSFCFVWLYIFRFQQGSWKKIDLINEAPTKEELSLSTPIPQKIESVPENDNNH